MKTTMTTQEFATANGLEYGEAAGMLKGLVKMGIVTDEGVRKVEGAKGKGSNLFGVPAEATIQFKTVNSMVSA